MTTASRRAALHQHAASQRLGLLLLALFYAFSSGCVSSSPVYTVSTVPVYTGNAPVRTLEEIQYGFERNRGVFYGIFRSHLRHNPAMHRARFVVTLTIAPDGSVTECHLVSSRFADKRLAAEVLAATKAINFGARDVPSFTYESYPINFIPS